MSYEELVCCRLPVVKSFTMADSLAPWPSCRLMGWALGHHRMHERDIIHAMLAANLPLVMGDATQLRQVIHNLLQNAQDAVLDRTDQEKAPRIDLVTEEIHYKGSRDEMCTAVRLSITDNGPGFSTKILSRAFEPYVTSKPRGTGLGLAMVKKIIDEHGGRIDIQNRVDGNGANVSILLLKLAPAKE